MQVFTNLVENAITHTEKGGRVHLDIHPHGEAAVEFTVQDTGKGISPEELSRVFERFYQVDKSRKSKPKQGTGLGLAIVNGLVTFQPLDVLTMLGFIILIGVVVNNAILVVHQALNFMNPRDQQNEDHGPRSTDTHYGSFGI